MTRRGTGIGLGNAEGQSWLRSWVMESALDLLDAPEQVRLGLTLDDSGHVKSTSLAAEGWERAVETLAAREFDRVREEAERLGEALMGCDRLNLALYHNPLVFVRLLGALLWDSHTRGEPMRWQIDWARAFAATDTHRRDPVSPALDDLPF